MAASALKYFSFPLFSLATPVAFLDNEALHHQACPSAVGLFNSLLTMHGFCSKTDTV